MMLASRMSWGTLPSSQHCNKSLWRWMRRLVSLPTLMTSGGMPSLPGALLLARESMLLLSSSIVGSHQALSWLAGGSCSPLPCQSRRCPSSRAPGNALPISPFACAVCDNFTSDCFERGGLDCAWAQGLLHALVHCSNVAPVSWRVDALAKVLPVVVGALSSNPFVFTSSTSEGSRSLLIQHQICFKKQLL